MNYLFFLPTNWNRHDINSFFYGYINSKGRYCPIKQFTIDKFGKRVIESDNSHKGVEFNPNEVKHLH